MNIISFFKSKRHVKGKPPWGDYPSIYEHIKKNIDLSGKLSEPGQKLPDDDRLNNNGEIRWAEGALDGVASHHFAPKDVKKTARKVASLVDQIARRNSEAAQSELYDFFKENIIIEYLDEALEAIAGMEPPVYPHLYGYARRLVLKSADREPLKFGISLLGLTGNEDDLELIKKVGKHDDFTLYAAVAVTNILEEADDVLWELAKSVNGWGRINAVERLAETKNPEIKSWLLIEGYKNTVTYEYLAYTCAVAGDLHKALAKPVVSLDLISAAGDIINALIYGGPAEDIDFYEHAAQVIHDYLKHLQPNAAELTQLVAVSTILEFLSGDEEEWEDRTESGWDNYDRHELAAKAKQIIENPVWKKIVYENIDTDDEELFWTINQAAQILQLDIWDILIIRLEKAPHSSNSWHHVMNEVNSERIDLIIDIAMKSLPLEEIATGPGEALGLGNEYELHTCLDMILTGLERYPGYGWRLIETGLKSPVVRNRNMALRALCDWDRAADWPEEAESILRQLTVIEPNEDVKERLSRLLRGEKFDKF